MTLRSKTAVLLLADGAQWETAAVQLLDGPRTTLLQRCLDLPDLVASARTGTAEVAVVSASVLGLDAEVVGRLHAHGCSVVLIGIDDPAWLALGVDVVLAPEALENLPDRVEAVMAEQAAAQPSRLRETDPILGGGVDAIDQEVADLSASEPPGAERGSRIVVWGPVGAPGRTTVAVGVATELAADRDVLLVDADPYGGTVAQHLGLLDQASGLLATARTANAGRLTLETMAATTPRIGRRLRVLTGLPRADRWIEVRTRAFQELLRRGSQLADLVVVDAGFCLEEQTDPYGTAQARVMMTLESVRAADVLIAVGTTDPVGLTRLVRGLRDLSEIVPGMPIVVALNRVRPILAWGPGDLAEAIGAVAPHARIVELPDDPDAADRALMAGRAINEHADPPLRRALAELAELTTSVAEIAKP